MEDARRRAPDRRLGEVVEVDEVRHAVRGQLLGPVDAGRVRFLLAQEVEDELAAGTTLLEELAAKAGGTILARSRSPWVSTS